MRLLPLASLAAAVLACGTALAVPIENVPDPRPGSAVVDLTGTLRVEDQAAIDAQAARGKAGGELIVVVVGSVDGAVPREWTTRLFNRWRLDSGARNKGVLLMAAIQDRKAEIVVGDGFAAGVASFTDVVMSGTVVPRFKAGDPRGAMVEGARALVDKLLLASEAPTVDPNAAATAPSEPAAQPDPGAAAPETYSGNSSSESLLGRAGNLADQNPVPVYGGGLGALLGVFLGVRRYLRMKPRICPQCTIPMVRLDEQADDTHLTPGERKEEELGSVDYDIWMCVRCQHTLKLRYGAFFTSYSQCPSCHFKTLESTSRTVTAATEYSTGLAEVTQDCKQCSHHRTFTRTIPRKPKPTPSTSSRSSSSSSSSRSSGGSSSGRGSSGSW